jgi:phosphoribosylformylglycinamidine synthase
MALAGGIGADLMFNVCQHAARAFSEDQGVYIVTAPAGSLDGIDGVYPAGTVGGDSLRLLSEEIPLADLRAAHEGFFPKLMGSDLTPEF